MRRTTGLATATKAGTTTTTPRRRCSLCGTHTTQPCVTACEPAGETWADTSLNAVSGMWGVKMSLKIYMCRNTEETNIFLLFPQMPSGVCLRSCLHVRPLYSARRSTRARLRPVSTPTKPGIRRGLRSTSIPWTSPVPLSNHGPRPGGDLCSGAWFSVAVRTTAEQFVRGEPINHRR